MVRSASASSFLEPSSLRALPLLESGPDDRYFDYCLEPYRPRRTWQNKLRSENLLWLSLATGHALDALRPPLLALQDQLGKDMTVWGVKWDGTRLFWEIYVYDPAKEDPNATIREIARLLEPWFRFLPCPPETIPYQMVSFDLDDAVIARKTIEEVNLYLTGGPGHAGRSYKARASGFELENTYRFFEAKRQIEELLPLLKASVYVDYTDPSRLSKVLIPELFACKKICVAKKRFRDGVYFSGIAAPQLLFFLKHFSYPAPIVDFVARRQASFEHLSFDVGIDYVASEDGRVTYPKTSFYGTL
jgi:hypothetical protein